MNPALSAEKLVKLFPGVRALDGANLRVEPGSVHALLGENGAGKSSRQVMGFIHADQPDAAA